MENNNQYNLNPQQVLTNHTTPTPAKKFSNKIITMVFLAIVAGGVSWIALSQRPKTDLNPMVVNHKATKDQAPQVKIKNDEWQTYKNSVLGFEIQYPKDLQYSETVSANGRRTIIKFGTAEQIETKKHIVGISVENDWLSLNSLEKSKYFQDFELAFGTTSPTTLADGTAAREITALSAVDHKTPFYEILFVKGGNKFEIYSTGYSMSSDEAINLTQSLVKTMSFIR